MLRTIFESEVIEPAKKFISIPTVNPPGINFYEFVSFSVTTLRNLGFDVRECRVSRDEFKCYGIGEETEDRVNIIAVKRFSSKGMKVHTHIHYDVVPPSSSWSKDPFKPFIVDEKLSVVEHQI